MGKHIPVSIGLSPALGIRGVLAARDLRKGELIEKCPLILIPVEQEAALKQTVLGSYHYEWSNSHHALALGYAGLCNHSYTPNVSFHIDYRNRSLNYRALARIKQGEELTVNYNGWIDDHTPLESKYLEPTPQTRSNLSSCQAIDLPMVVGLSPTLGIRGLLAARDIAAGEVIERCPVAPIPVEQEDALEATVFSTYYFLWTDTHYALALGYGSLFNHSYRANVDFDHDFEGQQVIFTAVKAIRQGDELTINYNGEPDDDAPIHPDFLK
jgi:hypothetical protein